MGQTNERPHVYRDNYQLLHLVGRLTDQPRPFSGFRFARFDAGPVSRALALLSLVQAGYLTVPALGRVVWRDIPILLNRLCSATARQ